MTVVNRVILLAFFCLLMPLCAWAQAEEPAGVPLPVKIDGAWGYINRAGEIALPATYDTATHFFGDQYAFVRKGDQWGVISPELKLLLPLQQEELTTFGPAVFMAKNGTEHRLYKASGQLLVPDVFHRIVPERPLVELRTRNAIRYEHLQLLKVFQKERCGIVDEQGNYIVPLKYGQITYYQDSLFLVARGNQVGLLAWGGKEILPVAYDEIDQPQKSLIRFRKGEYWGYILESGIQTKAEWKGIQLIGDNYLKLQTDTGKILIALPSQELISADYDDYHTGTEEHIVVSKNKRVGLIDFENELLIPVKYEEILPVKKGYFKVRKNGLFGLMNLEADTLLSFKYHDILDHPTSLSAGPEDFEQSLVDLIYRKKMGIGDTLGRELVPPKFDHVVPVKERFLLTKRGNKLGLYNSSGKFLAHPEYDRIGTSKTYGMVLRKGDCFALATLDSLVAGPENDRIVLTSGIAKVYRDQSLKVISFNDTGAMTEVVTYDSIPSFKVRVPALRKLDDWTQPETMLNHYKWFFSQGTSTYGLRHVQHGQVGMQPTFEKVYDAGMDYVSVVQKKVDTVYVTIGPYRFATDRLFGLVNTKNASVILEPEFVMIDLLKRSQMDPTKVLGRESFYALRPDGTYRMLHPKFQKDEEITFVEPKYNLVRTVATGGTMNIRKAAPGTGLKKLRDHLLEIKKYNPYLQLDSGKITDWIDDSLQIFVEDASWNYVNWMGSANRAPDAFVNYREIRAANPMLGMSTIYQNGSGNFGVVSFLAQDKIRPQYMSLERFNIDGVNVYAAATAQSLYGYIDTTGLVRISSRYAAAADFKGMYATVQDSGRWGLMNQQGEWHLPPKYQEVFAYREGMARVRGPNGFGFLDEQGMAVGEFDFDNAEDFSGGLALVKQGQERYYINADGERTLEAGRRSGSFQGTFAVSKSGDNYGIIDQAGEWALSPKYDKVLAPQANGLVVVRKNKKYRLYHLKKGTFLTGWDFDRIGEESEGLYAVYEEGRWGYIDTLGEQVVPFQYRKAGPFVEDRAIVKARKYWGVIASDGSWVLDAEWKSVSPFRNGIAEVGNDSARFLVNGTGQILFDLGPHTWVHSGADYHVLARGGRQFFVDLQGQPLFEPEVNFEEALLFEGNTARVKDRGKWGLIDREGKWILLPRYASIESFRNGRARIEISPLMGVLDGRGEWILDPKYELAQPVDLNLFRVERDDEVGYLQKDGQWLWPLRR